MTRRDPQSGDNHPNARHRQSKEGPHILAKLKRKTSSTWPRLTLPWHKSIVMRSSGVAVAVMFCGYLVSVLMGIQSIKTISRLAHDTEIEQALEIQLKQIKYVHKLQQELISEKIRSLILASPKKYTSGLGKPMVRDLIVQATKNLDIETDKLLIRPEQNTSTDSLVRAPASWIGRSKLLLFGHEVTFPKGKIYRAFKSAEAIQQRYHLVGMELDGNIRPTLIKVNAFILLVSFLLLMITFFLMARKFRNVIQEVLHGLGKWSTADFNFRFTTHSSGELGLITKQFNAMAEDVESTRKKSVYLEKIASWQVIARKLAHEIKNPLTPIQMMVSQLHRSYKGDDPGFAALLKDAQSIISEEVSGLRRMVDNFSEFARLPLPRPTNTDLVETAKHVLQLQRSAFSQHKMYYHGTLDSAEAWVDDGLIRQILINLTKNAAEAAGDDPVEITIGIDEDIDHFIIKIKDTGPGIPEDIQKRIFEAYFTTKHTGPTPGMGLGLAICQKIILDHKGEVSVTSRPGETIFSIRLPKLNKEI